MSHKQYHEGPFHVIRYPGCYIIQDRRTPTADSMGSFVSEHRSREAAHAKATKLNKQVATERETQP